MAVSPSKVNSLEQTSEFWNQEYLSNLRTEQSKDKFCMQLEEWSTDSKLIPVSKRGYFKSFSKNDKELWVYKDIAVVVPEGPKRLFFLEHFHDRIDHGHYGFLKTMEQLKQVAYWDSIADDVMKFIKSCDKCQRSRQENMLPEGLLHPLPVPEARFDSVNIDFAEMPKSHNGYDCVMVIKDRFSKIVEFIACTKKITSMDAAELLYRKWFLKGFRFPKEIVSDRDTRFISDFWMSLCKKLGISQVMSTARHQQTDGGAEIMVKMLKTGLKKICNYRQDDWDEHLLTLQFAYNKSINNSTGFTPFYLAFAFQPLTYPNFKKRDNFPATFRKYADDLDMAHKNLFDSQQVMANSYNSRHRLAPKYEVGNLVLLHRDGINWPPSSEVSVKLLQPYLGPFEILEVDHAKDNVRLKLPPQMRCHDVFHVSKVLKWYKADEYFPGRAVPDNPVPELDPEGEMSLEVDEILDSRVYGRWKKRQFLVRWLGYDTSHDTWEPLENLAFCPEKLEDYLKKHPIQGFSFKTALKELGGV
jgi:transposase InsO family protein